MSCFICTKPKMDSFVIFPHSHTAAHQSYKLIALDKTGDTSVVPNLSH